MAYIPRQTASMVCYCLVLTYTIIFVSLSHCPGAFEMKKHHQIITLYLQTTKKLLTGLYKGPADHTASVYVEVVFISIGKYL